MYKVITTLGTSSIPRGKVIRKQIYVNKHRSTLELKIHLHGVVCFLVLDCKCKFPAFSFVDNLKRETQK